VHVLDLALWLMGNPQPVRVSAMTQRKFGTRPEIAKLLRSAWDPEKFDVEDFAVALVHFANDASLLLRASWVAHVETQQFNVRLVGTEAGATTMPPTIFHNREGIPADETLQVGQSAMHEREMAHWLKVITGEAQPLVAPEETLNVQRILDAAYRSAAESREVDVAP
jgi:predicted dehydrogenase